MVKLIVVGILILVCVLYAFMYVIEKKELRDEYDKQMATSMQLFIQGDQSPFASCGTEFLLYLEDEFKGYTDNEYSDISNYLIMAQTELLSRIHKDCQT